EKAKLARELEADAATAVTAEPAAPTSAPTDTAIVALQPETRQTYEHAVAKIEAHAQELVQVVESLGDAAPSDVMSSVVDHVQWLSDHLNENGAETDVSLQRARDMAFDAADIVQLMQMEKRDSAAVEAVKVLLQIKRELQADLAA
ncbi:MAG: hypothetical protein AAGF56_08685, partial [Pseudomonadota bacterium]